MCPILRGISYFTILLMLLSPAFGASKKSVSDSATRESVSVSDSTTPKKKSSSKSKSSTKSGKSGKSAKSSKSKSSSKSNKKSTSGSKSKKQKKVEAPSPATLKKQLTAYQKSFSTVAGKMVTAKLRRADRSKVMGWQQTCRTARGGELTKEMVEQTVMPAYNGIYAECWVEPVDVLAENVELQDARTALLELSSIWDEMATESMEKQEAMMKKVMKQMGTAGESFEPILIMPPTFAQLVEQIEFDCVLYSYTATPQGKSVGQFNKAQIFSIDIQEARCVAATNRYRILLGLEPQIIDVGLCVVARDHSRDMNTMSFFSHESPVEGKKSFSDRANRMGVRGASSENIFAGSQDGFSAADAWFHSPGHHKNMMNDSPRTGVGRYDGHYTQMTGRK